ncbi:hypothetical protein DID80_00780 [Candidatus Marinamargulisbacteria bacterium SCGC AAA071-K20]|nr:hypothetical protein DID80_00780 [Candidatus Marinamargulisbacteria bacterium SCGC AAA071-K20]
MITSQTIQTIQDIYRLVDADLKAVDGHISDILLNAQNSATTEMCTHLLKANGKRIRPVLTLLVARALSDKKTIQNNYQKLIQISSAIELIHMASLVHDDVIDNSEVRRSQQSVNVAFGNSKAVTMGVYLYSMSLVQIAEAKSIEALSSLSAAVKGMCEGELSQLDTRQELKFDFDLYTKIISNKTADLFQAACYCGAILINKETFIGDTVKQFGHQLGILFQLTDDYLDYFSDGASLKKEVGQDYKDKQVTLPVLLYASKLDTVEKGLLKNLIEGQTLSFEAFLKRLEDNNIKEESFEYISNLKDDCLLQLEKMDESDYKLALAALVEIVFQRINP